LSEAGLTIVEGKLNGMKVEVLRDTGCTCVVVNRKLIKDKMLTGEACDLKTISGEVITAPRAKVNIECEYFKGVVNAVCVYNLMVDVIIGQVKGASEAVFQEQVPIGKQNTCLAVETRAQKVKLNKLNPLKVTDSILDITPKEFKKMQLEDKTLSTVRNLAKNNIIKYGKGGTFVKFVFKKELLYREFHNHGQVNTQLVLPIDCREIVMKTAHENLMAGHLGIKRTCDRVTFHFYWPSVWTEVTRHCKSCEICQRAVTGGQVPKVPLVSMPRIDVPFKCVGIDIIGPLRPMTERKKKYILVMVDYATRYPDAIALQGISTQEVAEAMVEMFSRLGIPEEILTDRGSQFTSDHMNELSRLLSIKQLTTTAYRPMCNGLVERFNGTLKKILQKMCTERPTDWDRYLSAALFAYREVKHESLGYSPFELLYGRKVRGPLQILKALWSSEQTTPDEVKSTYKHVIELRNRLEETCKLAQEQLKRAKIIQKSNYDKGSVARSFRKNDKVLVLQPRRQNKLLLKWKGPYEIVERINQVNYKVNVRGKVKTMHANRMKRFIERVPLTEVIGAFATVDAERVEEFSESTWQDDILPLEVSIEQGTETWQHVHVSNEVTRQQDSEIKRVLETFMDVLTDMPGTTNLVKHKIKVNTSDPIRFKGHQVPYKTQDLVKQEIDKMLSMKIIEPSSAPYSSPIVMVIKPDKTPRFCIDFRLLNRLTIFDAEPLPNIDSMLVKFAGSVYFSKIDLTKGYWQVPMDEESKDFTSFQSPEGLFRFNKMPFGLVNAPATFSRLMRMVLKDLKCVDNFVDDIIIHSRTWDEHVKDVTEVLQRLRQAKLTARPTKCFIGYKQIECLGYLIGESGTLEPIPDKVKAIQEIKRPQTKKEVRSFLGMVAFYSRFIPGYATLAAPLTDLTKKIAPNKVNWGDCQEKAFNRLKDCLTKSPVLRLPDCKESFILRTDASDTGLGAVLEQNINGCKQPVAYASRKLLDREKNFTVMEKECLAVIWAIAKFHKYLFGQEFILETDHEPLLYINRSKLNNSRIMRWALALQPYRITVKAIAGKENRDADFLSRIS
jgi:RNase H-like domain found in reverse transcriptase/Reverse transcriptase (RNA-dependent DNA polymerase)/Integrase zinc binding domain/Integrase core domain